ncbi:MAG: hypothetical protein P8188_13590 [Gemmatimonadota bacterium]
MNLPLASSDVEEISSVAEDRSGVIRWRGADAPEVRAEIGTITRDSLSYAELEGTQLLWASLAEVSRVEFPYSRTRNVLVGSVSGALGGALGFLATTGYFALLLCDDDCDLQWGRAAGRGAVYGGIIGAVLGLLANEIDPPAFEFSPGS